MKHQIINSLQFLLLFICVLTTLFCFIATAQMTNGQNAIGVLGQTQFTTSSYATSQSGMYGPNGSAVDGLGNLYVADQLNNRVLKFSNAASKASGTNADVVFGQANFTSNAAAATQNGMNSPRGVAVDGSGNLYVADYYNNRVLKFSNAASKANGANADVVFGQANFTSTTATATQSGMYGPSGVAVDGSGNLYVAESNSRVLKFSNAASKANGANADGVLGQADFTSMTAATAQNRMYGPTHVAVDGSGNLYVVDQWNYRVLKFSNAASKANGANADGVLGQANFTSAASAITQNGMNLPRGVAVDGSGNLYVADGNNRVLIFSNAASKTNGANADVVLGQTNFTSNLVATTQSGMSYPNGVAVDNTSKKLFVAENGNHRVLIFNIGSSVSSSITVTSPNGGENWQVGSSNNIAWTSSNISNVMIEYSTNNGSSWNVISSSYPAFGPVSLRGSYSWTVPNTPSTQCKVRISDVANPTTVQDMSDAVFTIITSTSSNSFTQQGSKLVGAGGSAAYFGFSVSLSSDGNTAIVGGPQDNGLTGAAWIFTRSSGTWTQQGNKLIGSDAVGSASQSISSAISADGNTVIFGGWNDNSYQGAAWVFTRSGGVWSQQGKKLVGTGGIGSTYQGYSVGISADGNTAIVSGHNDNYHQGAVWIFTRSGGSWSQQAKLIGTGNTGPADQGISVAISADGNTAMVGGYSDNSNQGAAWIFTRSGGVWTQQGNKLVGSNSSSNARQGLSVALSSDGNTAIIGANEDNTGQGAAWIFVRLGGVWAQQGNKLVGTGNTGTANQGVSVALSGDGNIAIVGGLYDNASQGAAWIFTRLGGVWSQLGNKLVGSGSISVSHQGYAVDISADGNTVIIGGPADNSYTGAAWIFSSGGSSASSVTVTSPNGGENWQVGSSHNISWTSTNVTNVMLEYSTNSGSSWNGVVTSYPASGGSYAWTVPNAPSTQCKVRVSDAANVTTITDQSDNVFTISSSVTPPPVTSEWMHYTNCNYINDILNDGQYLWIASQDGGVVQFNKTTNERIFYTPANTGGKLPGYNVTSIAKDQSGTFWFSCYEGGLAKFDGTTWTTWKPNAGLPIDWRLKQVAIDASGNKWIINVEGLHKFDGTKWTSFTNTQFSASGLYCLVIDNAGIKWIGSDHGLWKFDTAPIQNWWTGNSQIPSDQVYRLALEQNGTKWIGTFHSWLDNGAGVAKFDGTTWTTYANFPNNGIRAVYVDNNNNKWIGFHDGGGLAKYDGSTWTFYRPTNSKIPHSTTIEITGDNTGTIWMGGLYNHWGGDPCLVKYDGSTFTKYYIGLAGNTITNILVESNGNKWISTTDGLTLLNGTTLTNYNSVNSQLPANNVVDVRVDNAGTKWIGTTGGLAKFDGTNWTIYTTANSGLPYHGVSSIAIDNGNVKWLGLGHAGSTGGETSGLTRFDGTTWTSYNKSNSGLVGNDVAKVVIDASGNKWVATSEGLSKFNGTQWVSYTTINSQLSSNDVHSLVFDRNGALWIGTFSGGLARLDGSTWTKWTTTNGMPQNDIYAIDIDAQNNKWIGYYWGSVAKFDNSTFTMLNTTNSSLADINVHAVVIDAGGIKWFGSNLGVNAYTGTGTPVGVKEYATEIPSRFELEQNYPNPFNPSTRIQYHLPISGFVTLNIYDALGREVSSLVNNHQNAGDYSVTFCPINLSSGVYFYRIQSGIYTETKKLLFLK